MSLPLPTAETGSPRPTHITVLSLSLIHIYTDWDQYIASMNKGEAAGVIQGCWIMSSIQAAEDQSGEWAIVNMPALDEIDGATNYANCGGASWAVSSNCKNTELAFDFLNATFGSSVDLYDELLPNAGVIASYLPAAASDAYGEASESVSYTHLDVYKRQLLHSAQQLPWRFHRYTS